MLYNEYFTEPQINATLEEKLALIKSNYKKARELESKINLIISEKNSFNPVVTNTNPEKIIPKVAKINTKLNEVANEFSLFNIRTLSDEEVMNKLKEYLKCLEFSNWELRLKLYEEIVSYEEILLEANTEEDIMELKATIAELSRKINLLKDLEEEQELLNDSATNNNIFFLTSLNENIYFLESLRKSVPKEFYPDFLTLLEGIKYGKFPGLKKLNSLSYFEVKLFKIRITFARLSANNYLIIDGFMKKEDTSSYYKNMLANKNNQFLAVKDKYLTLISQPEFVNTHRNYYNDIIDFLNTKDKDLEEKLCLN